MTWRIQDEPKLVVCGTHFVAGGLYICQRFPWPIPVRVFETIKSWHPQGFVSLSIPKVLQSAEVQPSFSAMFTDRRALGEEVMEVLVPLW
jgi:hypothetical protein